MRTHSCRKDLLYGDQKHWMETHAGSGKRTASDSMDNLCPIFGLSLTNIRAHYYLLYSVPVGVGLYIHTLLGHAPGKAIDVDNNIIGTDVRNEYWVFRRAKFSAVVTVVGLLPFTAKLCLLFVYRPQQTWTKAHFNSGIWQPNATRFCLQNNVVAIATSVSTPQRASIWSEAPAMNAANYKWTITLLSVWQFL